ncbi:protein-tyrosine-phosphatase [Cryomorphaceae bacterium 1068]|nr:protein-tyrosine-phosphatase [Cryomorphaceae bacterium 1068]
MALYPQIEETVSKIDLATVPLERRKILQPLVYYIREQVIKGLSARLNFICTHNSRRSHLSQIWAQAIAYRCGFGNVFSYSGGTESTALYPMVAETLRKQGFQIETISESQNPIYAMKYSRNEPPVIGFSKKWDHDFNPQSEFAAILTCSQADEACPFIAGAEVRIPVTYEDPKRYDDKPQQAEKYAERSLQIATEMKYVFENVRKELRVQ